MKVCVYAICKNETKNIDSWVESMMEADKIFVLDTGSTDDSVDKLKRLGVNVCSKKIEPWRFDKARNESLALVDDDTDIFVCTDIDETFTKGWRQQIEKKYVEGTTRIRYLYNWAFNESGNPATTFYLNKIHTKGYHWNNAVHEVLVPDLNEKELFIDGFCLNHHQDNTKDRSSYLNLLELSVKENPEDDRNVHYLGREYMYYKMHDLCIKTLHNHLKLKGATWKDERAASMRYIARSYLEKNYIEEAIMWFNLAIEEAPYLREAYVELAYVCYNNHNYQDAVWLLDNAFNIKEKSKNYINENFAWDWQIYDLYALCNYYLNKKEIAYAYEKKAISMCPNNDTLKNNLTFFDEN